MHFPSLHSWFRCSVCFYLKCSSSHNQRVIQRVKKHFFVKICFKSCIIKNRSQMYTSEKNTKQLTVRGAGSTPTVSLTVKYPFFFDGFPYLSPIADKVTAMIRTQNMILMPSKISLAKNTILFLSDTTLISLVASFLILSSCLQACFFSTVFSSSSRRYLREHLDVQSTLNNIGLS